MIQKLNNYNGLQDWKTEHQVVTGGIFYCGDSAYLSVSASNKFSCNLSGQRSETCLPIGRSATKNNRQSLVFNI